jgi:Tol biopolymer transport system component
MARGWSLSDFVATHPAIHYDLSVCDRDGTHVNRLASLTNWASDPAWSPDGRKILFTTAGAIHVMNVDGSLLARVTTPPRNSWDDAPAWKR